MRLGRAVEHLGHAGVRAGGEGEGGVQPAGGELLAEALQVADGHAHRVGDGLVGVVPVGVGVVGQQEDGGPPRRGHADGRLAGDAVPVGVLLVGQGDLVLGDGRRHPVLRVWDGKATAYPQPDIER